MKYLAKFSLFGALVILPLIALAQGSGSSSPPSGSGSSSGGSAETSGGGAVRQTANEILRDESIFIVTRAVSGELVDVKDGILTVKTKKDKHVKLFFNDRTRIKIGPKTLKLNEIEDGQINIGQRLRITYMPIDDFRAPTDKLAFEIKLLDIP